MRSATLQSNKLDSEIEAYEAMREELESKHTGKWVLLQHRKLISIYESFEVAAESAVRRFGRGPFLIRQVGAPPVALPASLMYQPRYARGKMRF